MRREIPVFLTVFFGCFMVIQFFVPHPWVTTISERLQSWTVIVAAAAILLGVANVVRINVKKLARRELDHAYSIPLLAGLFVMMLLGCLPASVWTGLGASTGGIEPGSPFDWMYNWTYVPMQGTMFGLLAFYIASAAFRAFRIRSVEAGLLAIAAVLVMIGRVPLGAAISDWLPQVQSWIMDYPNNAGKRAILIGAALGAIATSLKIILGIEKSSVGSD